MAGAAAVSGGEQVCYPRKAFLEDTFTAVDDWGEYEALSATGVYFSW